MFKKLPKTADQSTNTDTVWYDPPEGWKYGFPKAYVPLDKEPLELTLIRDGYPKEKIFKDKHGNAAHVRFIGKIDKLREIHYNVGYSCR